MERGRTCHGALSTNQDKSSRFQGFAPAFLGTAPMTILAAFANSIVWSVQTSDHFALPMARGIRTRFAKAISEKREMDAIAAPVLLAAPETERLREPPEERPKRPTRGSLRPPYLSGLHNRPAGQPATTVGPLGPQPTTLGRSKASKGIAIIRGTLNNHSQKLIKLRSSNRHEIAGPATTSSKAL